ncbi:MAG: ABC transporter substrate-binding protein, partial [Chloroflexota bacterium]
EALFGVKLATQTRNQTGGVQGYQVELVALNDFDDVEEAKLQANALIADPEILGVVGHLSSPTTIAALPIYHAADLAVAAPWSLDFHQNLNQPDNIISLAATINETNDHLMETAEMMGYDQLLSLTNADTVAVTANTTAIHLMSDGVTAGEVILALQPNNELSLFGSVDVGSPQMTQVAQSAANGLIIVSPAPHPQDIEGGTEFIAEYQQLAGFPPGPRALLAYEATHILLDAIDQAMLISIDKPTRKQVSQLIKTIQRDSLIGPIKFDEKGYRIEAPTWIYQIEGETYPGKLLNQR